ncbi:hypothetical protein OEZ86_002151 [Tetradesmus obliquus]|nr:hypothetical protein OEZ86_002151 [Tetradesmus obliquus]
MSPPAWPGLAVILLLLGAASTAARDVAPSHKGRDSDEVTPATHGGGSWLQPGDACSLKRTSGQAWARCRPGSFCACSCVAVGIPVGGNDTFAFSGPGLVSVSVLDNDASPDGSPVSIAPGSVESLTPGVTVASVDEAQGIISINIPAGAPSVLLRYVPAASGNRLGAAAYVVGTSAVLYPAGTCRPVTADSYCMGNFKTNCADPDNAGCNRCAIYKVMQACEASYKTANPPPFPAPDQNPTGACRCYSSSGNYVIVKSRAGDRSANATDPETGNNLCIMPKHFILMPTEACTGVDDPNPKCTGPAVTYWDGAVRHGYGTTKPGDLGLGLSDWVVMINAAGEAARHERGQHQMHIHVAPMALSNASNIFWAAKQAKLEADMRKDPTVLTLTVGSGKYMHNHTVAAYFVKDSNMPPTSVVKTDVYGTAASIHTKYTSSIKVDRNQLAYRVALIPKKGGYVVAATYGFADEETLDMGIVNTPRDDYCQAACAPFK